MTQSVEPRTTALAVFSRALATLSPRLLVRRALAEWTLPPHVRVLAVGKAAGEMMAGALEALGDRVVDPWVLAKDGHSWPSGVAGVTASHPVPDARSVAAALELRARATARLPGGLVVLAISGGASALAALPTTGLSLADKVAATCAVAAAGASIVELNVVRRHLSAIKGGRLVARATAPVLALLLSDVLGDDPAVIGGGLASADPSTFADALDVIARLGAEVPDAVRRHLEAGARGAKDETPKPGDPRLDHVETCVVCGPDQLVEVAAAQVPALGYMLAGTDPRVAAPVEVVAERLVAKAHELAAAVVVDGTPRAWVAGGEPTIRLPAGPLGRGGRAQHVALASASLLARRAPGGVDVAILCAATDGTDGPTGDAGGIVDGGTCNRALRAGVNADAALAAFDAGNVLAATGDLITTGPTGTNLCDLFVVTAAPTRQAD